MQTKILPMRVGGEIGEDFMLAKVTHALRNSDQLGKDYIDSMTFEQSLYLGEVRSRSSGSLHGCPI